MLDSIAKITNTSFESASSTPDISFFSFSPSEQDQAVSRVSTASLLKACLLKLSNTVAGRKHKDIYEEAKKCLELLEEITSDKSSKVEDSNSNNETRFEQKNHFTLTNAVIKQHAVQLFTPFKTACELKSARIILVSLDCIEKLLACGLFVGVTYNPEVLSKETEGPKPFIEDVLKTIIHCIEVSDETVQLQVLRCLLTCVVSNICGDLHGKSLISAVKAGFRIYELNDRSSQCQRTATAALTQIVNAIFRKLTGNRIELGISTKVFQSCISEKNKINTDVSISNEKTLQYTHESDSTKEQTKIAPPLYQTPRVSITKKDARSDSENLIQESFLCIICAQKTVNVCNSCKAQICESQMCHEKHDCDKACLITDPLHSSDNTRENELNPHEQNDHESNIVSLDILAKRDCYLVFELLCSLSMKSSTKGQVSEQNTIRTKVLSLELILSVLQTSTEFIRNDPDFIRCIRSTLCMSLIKNCVSHIPRVFAVSLSIFLVLAVSYKEYLRTEIGVFVDQILLRILESGNSTFEHKNRVLQVFRCLCTDAQVALELYLNFDCDVEEKDVLANSVDCLAKIAQGTYISLPSHRSSPPESQKALQLMGLEVLVTLVTSLLAWVRKCQRELDRLERQQEEQEELQHRNFNKSANVEDSGATLSPSDFTSESSAPLKDADPPGKPTEIVSMAAANQHLQMVEQKRKKLKLQEGVMMFNIKPLEGLKFLIEHGYIQNTPHSIASFFLRCSGLKKQVIGDYLGEADSFHQAVLYHLVDQLDFKGQEIDTALRHFLTMFRLPGEAQKIDRMMERFAHKYIQENPGKFATADCAYVLAFSLIMLHTDAHSRSIKPENKMTMDVFVKNNRGINDHQDLPVSYLEKLYNRVVSEEWVMEEDRENKQMFESQQLMQQLEGLTVALGLALPVASRRKFELFLKESSGMVRKTTELIRRRGRGPAHEEASQKTTYFQSHSDKKGENQYVVAVPQLAGQVRFLFESCHLALLATFSVLMQSNEDDTTMTQLILQGFEASTQLASHFLLCSEVELFVSSLSKFTGFTGVAKSAEALLTERNVRCIQTLLKIALTEGNTIQVSWRPILECASRVHRLEMALSGGIDTIFSETATVSDAPKIHATQKAQRLTSIDSIKQNDISESDFHSTTQTSFSKLSSKPLLETSKTGFLEFTDNETGNIELSSEMEPCINAYDSTNAAFVLSYVNMSHVDLLFIRSVSLTSSAIVHFVSALCEVSRDELNGKPPRLFSLQKLVEVADHNMNRIRLIWSKIWAVLQEHFIEAASHPNKHVSLYAVDSLRQLAMKFLEKDELSNYSFQNEFLKPFHVIMKNFSTIEEIKDFIIQLISNMVQTRVNNIKSGWKSVFNILATAGIVISPTTQSESFTTDTNIQNKRIFLLGLQRARHALDVVILILKNYFWVIADNIGELVRCLVTFGLLHSTGDGYALAFSSAINAIQYLEGTALVLADEEYQVYLKNKYCNSDDVVIAVNGLPIRVKQTTDELTSKEFENEPVARRHIVGVAKFQGIAPGTVAETYLDCIWRSRELKEELQNLENCESSDSDLVNRLVCLKETLANAERDRQQQLSGPWFSVFTGLTHLSASAQVLPVVREAALKALFGLLIRLGNKHLNRDLWFMTVRGVLRPLFDDLHLQIQQQQSQIDFNEVSSKQSNDKLNELQQIIEAKQLDDQLNKFEANQKETKQANESETTDLLSKPTGILEEAIDLQKPYESKACIPLLSEPITRKLPSAILDLLDSNSQQKHAVMRCWISLVNLVELTCQQFTSIREFLFEILSLLELCIFDQTEYCARMGIESLKDLIERIASCCNLEDWKNISKYLISLLHKTSQDEFLVNCPQNINEEKKSLLEFNFSGYDSGGNDVFMLQFNKEDFLLTQLLQVPRFENKSVSEVTETIQTIPFDIDDVTLRSVIQLHLLSMIRTTCNVLVTYMPSNCIIDMLKPIKRSFFLARNFNRRVEWRHRLTSLGFVRQTRQLPGLIKQEREALCTMFELILNKLNKEVNDIQKSKSITTITSLNSPDPDFIPRFSVLFLQLLKYVTQQCLYYEEVQAENEILSLRPSQPELSPNANLPHLSRVEIRRELTGVVSVLTSVVIPLLDNSLDELLNKIRAPLFVILIHLMLCNSKELRVSVKSLILKHYQKCNF